MSAGSEVLPLVALSGGVVAAVLVARSRDAHAANVATATQRGHAESGATTAQPAGWIFPVPSLAGRAAVISDGFGSPRTRADGSKEKHLGADLMFRRIDARDLIAVYPPGTVLGTKGYFMPDGVPALAASQGVVRFAALTPIGHTIIVHHPSGWATYYTHLSALAVARGDHVAAGQTIGTIGASPADARHLMHLHLELWKGATRSGAVDPAPYLAAWTRRSVAWPPTSATLTASAAELAPRNGSLSAYRTIGARGEPYPAWVRNLRGESGVYVIREIDGPIVYVGSSIRRLYETLTRHFQLWRRYKGYWREQQFAEGADPGLTYERSSVEVAVKVTTPDDAHDEELRLIRRLQPRDNQLGQPNLEDAPF